MVLTFKCLTLFYTSITIMNKLITIIIIECMKNYKTKYSYGSSALPFLKFIICKAHWCAKPIQCKNFITT